MRRRTAWASGLAPVFATLALVAGAPAPSARAAPPPRCEASAELVPGHAFVGQQVQYRLRILRRRDVTSLEWETPLSFPTFRAEWLPGVAGEDRFEQDGETYLVFVERRALFAAHPGRLEVPAASLRCTSPEGSEVAVVPALVLPVSELPAEGRPPGFSGLLGPLALDAVASSDRLVLGGSLRLSVIAQSDTNLWSMPSPRPALAQVPDLEAFEQPAELARDAGRNLTLRRYFNFDLVPRKEGVLRLPEIRVPYFDPATARYAEAVVALPLLRVAPAREAVPPPPRTSPVPEAATGPRARLGWLLFAAVAAALLAAAALRWRRGPGAPDPVAARLAEARTAASRGDAGAAARAAEQALRAALAGGPASPSAETAAAGAGTARDAAERLLAELERARFAAAAAAPALGSVEAAIARLRESSGRRR